MGNQNNILIYKPNPLRENLEEFMVSPVSPKDRAGLTSIDAEQRYRRFGYNELPEVKVSICHIFFLQFTRPIPFMLELSAIIAFGCRNWAVAAIICAILLIFGFHQFIEEMHSMASLTKLTQKMESKIKTIRDGKVEYMLTKLLVPGDVVLLLAGVLVPADIEWFDGDIIQVDTAALTGEPLHRKYPSREYGRMIMCGTTITTGEAYGIVRNTGKNTEIGRHEYNIKNKDKSISKIKTLLEQNVLFFMYLIMFLTLLDAFIVFLVQGTVRSQFTLSSVTRDFLSCLSIILAAIPSSVPIIFHITMTIGASKMAREYDVIVTSLPAIEDIASMTILCCDKTGTMTTARLEIHQESVWCGPNFNQKELLLYAALASNRDKKEDAIDRAVIKNFDKVYGIDGLRLISEYTKTRSVGFNPIYKRVLYEYTHPTVGKITIVKGLPNKVLDTADGGVDDADDQWKCQDYLKLRDEVKKVDNDFSKAGYKTLGVAVKINDGPFVFCGILPFLDPPRHDTKQTIANLNNAGIEVKMMTGDHLNIAKEIARLVGIGVDIYPGEAIREYGYDTNQKERLELIKRANGFAEVLPKDKRETVLALRYNFKEIVGITGDGCGCAPALAAAQCGIAVNDATDAARSAAALILVADGLSPIYSAVVISRKIMRTLKSYVIYRFAVIIQVVVVLTLIIFISNCSINSLFIILLAILNDLAMFPIAYDLQLASKTPEKQPFTIYKMIILSVTIGVIEMVFSLIFCYAAEPSLLFRSNFSINNCGTTMQGAIWVQLLISSELLIFSTRSPCLIPNYTIPSKYLFFSVFLGCFLVSLLAGCTSYFGLIQGTDIVIIWIYNVICLVIIDFIKSYICYLIEENSNNFLPEPLEQCRYDNKESDINIIEVFNPIAIVDNNRNSR